MNMFQNNFVKKLFLLILSFSCLDIAITKPLNNREFPKLTIRDSKLFDVNNISAWITNAGGLFRHPIILMIPVSVCTKLTGG